MATNDKKKILKDILGELEKDKNVPEKEDITGLEHKIPIIGGSDSNAAGNTSGIINFNTDPDTGDIEIPIPDGFAVREDTGYFEMLDPGKKEPLVKTEELQKPETSPKEEVTSSTKYETSDKSEAKYLSKLELLEQKLLMMEEENRKQLSTLTSQKTEIDEYREKLGKVEAENKKLRTELSNADSNIRMDLESQLNKAAIIEKKYNTLAQHHEEVKAKVRKDIQKIRMREKELANKLEMMRNDSETLLAAKDHKILQLKQHIDNLEFEAESLKEKVTTFQELAHENEEKAERVIKALRLSTSLLETGSKKE